MSPAVKYAILRIPIHPCATEEQGNHHEWFDKSTSAHGGVAG